MGTAASHHQPGSCEERRLQLRDSPSPRVGTCSPQHRTGFLLPREKATPPSVGHRSRAWQTPSSPQAGGPLGATAAPLHARSPVGRPHGINTSTHVCTRPHTHLLTGHICSHMHTLVHAYAHAREHVHRHDVCAPLGRVCAHANAGILHARAHTHVHTHTCTCTSERPAPRVSLPTSSGSVHQPHAVPKPIPSPLETSNPLNAHIFLTPGIWLPRCLLGEGSWAGRRGPGGGAGRMPRWNRSVDAAGH